MKNIDNELLDKRCNDWKQIKKDYGLGGKYDLYLKTHITNTDQLFSIGDRNELSWYLTHTNGEGVVRVEHKMDGSSQKSGNIYIETHQRTFYTDENGNKVEGKKLSGINVTEADIWVQEILLPNGEVVEITKSLPEWYELINEGIKMNLVRTNVKSAHLYSGGQTTWGYVIPVVWVAPHLQRYFKDIQTTHLYGVLDRDTYNFIYE